MTTTQDQLAILIDRAATGHALLPAEGAELCAIVQELRTRVGIAEARAEDWRLAARRSLHEQLAAEKRAEAAEFQADGLAVGVRAGRNLSDIYKQKAEAAEDRLNAAALVLHRWAGCQSNDAAALRLELLEALHRPATPSAVLTKTR